MLKIKLSREIFSECLLLVLCILIFIFPLSSEGAVNSKYGAIASVIVLFVSLCLLANNRINNNSFLIVSFMVMHLVVGTVLILSSNTGGVKFGYARMLYTFSTLIMFLIVINHKLSFKFCLRLLDAMMFFVIIGNLLAVLNIGNCNEILISNYTQYQEYLTRYHLGLKKPLLVFGVHNIAAFIYTGLFLISFFANALYKKKKHLIYAIVCFVLLLALRCSTSIGYAMFCTMFIVYYQTKTAKKTLITLIVLCIAVILADYYGLFDVYVSILGKESNGFISRYLKGYSTLYAGNIELIKQYLFGMGFCINDGTGSLYGADSGYLINLTIGNIVYTIVFYLLLIKCMRRNISGSFRLFSIIFILLMEFGFVTFLYFRTISFFIVFLCVMNSLTQNGKQIDNVGSELVDDK